MIGPICKGGVTMEWDERRKFRPDETAQPYGWIQWKGTNVCLDFYCACGEHSHLDSWFAYSVECGACHRVYGLSAHVEAVELTPQEAADEVDPRLTERDDF